jgi:AcrR family transcriptional regulator
VTPSGSAPSPRTDRRRTGRRPGESTTQEAILEAARVAFASQGYNGASLRGIARDAGVDPALIVHFFGSKGGLITAAVEWPFDPDQEIEEILADGPDHVGERLARAFIEHWDETRVRSPILSLMHAAITDERVAALMREFMMARLALPIMRRLAVDEPSLRAALLASQLLGVGISRYALELDGLANISADRLIATFGPLLQRVCTAPI